MTNTASTKTMAQGVAFMNTVFGNKTLDVNDPNFWAKLSNQCKLIEEEVKETRDLGIDVRNRREVRDGVCDILVTALGLAHIAGFPVEEDMLAVFNSNMSKICYSSEAVIATQKKYADIGVETYVEASPQTGGWIIKVDGDQVGTDSKKYPHGKFLKCAIGYKEPVFSVLSE